MAQKDNILITGANGLLGKRAVAQLRDDYNVYAIVRKKPENGYDDVEYLNIDLSSEWSCDDLPNSLEAVVHLAQSSKFRDFPNSAMDIFNVNIASTARLLDYAYSHGAKHFVYASSGGVYGSGEGAFNENATISSNGHLGYYLGSKLCGEVVARNYADLMSVITMRFFFMYGAEQDKSMLIPRLVENVRAGSPITLQGQDGIQINPIHAQDAVGALCKSLKLNKSYTFNIAGPETLSLRAIAEKIGDVVGREPIFEIQDTEARHLIADITAMEEKLAVPKISFEDGIKDFGDAN